MSPKPPDEGRVCREEETAQSKIPGPGPVKNSEHLARIVLTPLHWRNGKLDNSFLSIDELERGASFIRREIAGEDKIKAHGERRADAKSGRKMHGYAVIKAAEFRSVADYSSGRQAFCILDDECEDAPAHAVAKHSAPRSRGENRALRDKVMDKLRGNLTLC